MPSSIRYWIEAVVDWWHRKNPAGSDSLFGFAPIVKKLVALEVLDLEVLDELDFDDLDSDEEELRHRQRRLKKPSV